MSCARFEDLLDWWSDARDDDADDPIALHLLSCDRCASLASTIARLAAAVRSLDGAALGRVFVTDALQNQLARAGVRMRLYHLSAGEVVPCAVAEDDELVITRLYSRPEDLAGVERVDLVADAGGMALGRVEDLPVNRQRSEIAFADTASLVRTIPGGTRVTLRLIGITGGEERVLGDYVLEHEERS